MAIFNFTSVNIKGNSRKGEYASQATVSGTNSGMYNANIYRYPLDIGSMDKGHYMVIHVNQQEHTKYPATLATGDLPTIIQNRIDLQKTNRADDARKTLAIAGAASGKLASVIDDATKSTVGSSTLKTTEDLANSVGWKNIKKGLTSDAGVRTIKRTTDTIALYMPDTVNFQHNQSYSELSTTGLAAGALSVGASLSDSLKGQTDPKKAKEKFLSNMSPFLAKLALKDFGDFGKAIFAGGYGSVENPMLELLYQSPQFREFRFDFMLYPRSQKEAKSVYDIINRLHFHQAPEVRQELSSYFMVPPSEFDIKFYYNGQENPNIPKISTCVLTAIDVDYAPNGFATYEVPGQTTATPGGTGMPVAIRLSLQFKETEILTKDNFQNGYTSGKPNPRALMEKQSTTSFDNQG